MIKGLDVVGFNYIVQNDVDNRKKANPDWKIVGTEETTGCGTRGVYFESKEQPGHMVSMNRGTKPGVENVIERGWKFYDERPWAAGLFYWTGFDYRGEPNPLEYPAHESEFGILDYCGFMKDEAWYLYGQTSLCCIYSHTGICKDMKVKLWRFGRIATATKWN